MTGKIEPRRRSLSALVLAAHLFALSGLAVAQPLFDLLSRQATFFVAHDSRPIELVLMALALSLLLPLALVLLVQSAALLGATFGRWLHYALVAALSSLIALQVLKRLAPSLAPVPSIAAAAALGVLATVAYSRLGVCRSFLTLLSPSALLFPLLFLFASPVRALVLPATVAVAGGPGVDAAPVVMVAFDELPLTSLLDASGQVDPVRYPNFAALARDSHWFRDTTTAAKKTVVAMPIILSGRLPEHRELLPQASDHPANLFTWLGGAGYRMNVQETFTRLCPRSLCSADALYRDPLAQRLDDLASDLVVVYLHLVVPDALRVHLPAVEDRWSHFTDTTLGTRLARMVGGSPAAIAARVAARAQDDIEPLFAAFLEQIVPGDRPALHFIHVLQPHQPWRYLPSGKQYGQRVFFPHDDPGEGWNKEDEWEVVQRFQRHLLQVGYADRLLGRVVARLKQQGLYDRTMIALVTDHGATFRVGAPIRNVSRKHPADVLNVPFFLKLPEQKQPVVHDGGVGTVDVVPTLADALGVALPWPSDGHTALSSDAMSRAGRVTFRGKSWGLAKLRASRARSVARKLRLFGSGAQPGGLFRIGRRADLVGRRLADVGTAAAAGRDGVTVDLNEPWSFEELDPNAPYLPARISGRVRFRQPRAGFMELAVAINGTVEAVTRTVRHEGDRARFSAMVPERALRAGRNRIEVFEIAGGRSGGLIPTRQPNATAFALVGAAGNQKIRTPAGRVPLAASKAGKARVQTDGLRVWIDGRFAARSAGKERGTLLVFAGDRCVLARDSELSRRQARGAGASDRRFAIRLPNALGSGSSDLRLFLVTASAASEIAMS